MPRITDLVCDLRHVMKDVVVRHIDDPNPVCNVCGHETEVWWGSRRAPETKIWNPITIDVAGKPTTFETEKAFEDKIAACRSKGALDYDVVFPDKKFSENMREKIYEEKKARAKELNHGS